MATSADVVSFFKGGVLSFVGFVASNQTQGTFHLATDSSDTDRSVEDVLRRIFDGLEVEQKRDVFFQRYEIEKMEDPRIHGDRWGEEHMWDSARKAARAMHRCGLLGDGGVHRVRFNRHPFFGGETEGAFSTYFSLAEKLGRDPERGWIGYINGMATSFEEAVADVSVLSDRLARGSNIHGIYLPTKKGAPNDLRGTLLEIGRHLAVDGSTYSRASCLLVQQWIDYLTAHPEKNFLQISHSEGASHVNAALRILREVRPDLLARLKILAFCPAHFIKPEEREPLEVICLAKREDWAIVPWATGADSLGRSPHTHVVPHTAEQPLHDLRAEDYVTAARGYFDRFLDSGHLMLVF